MAICPQCKASIGMTDIKCAGCGYDFPQKYWPSEHEGKWEWNRYSDMALVVGGFCSLIASFITLFLALMTFGSVGLLPGLLGVLYSITLYGIFVALMRVKSLNPPSE